YMAASAHASAYRASAPPLAATPTLARGWIRWPAMTAGPARAAPIAVANSSGARCGAIRVNSSPPWRIRQPPFGTARESRRATAGEAVEDVGYRSAGHGGAPHGTRGAPGRAAQPHMADQPAPEPVWWLVALPVGRAERIGAPRLVDTSRPGKPGRWRASGRV